MKEEKDIVMSILLIALGLQLLLIAIKLLGFVSWSWWIILIPAEIYFGIGVVAGLLIVLYIVFVERW